MFRIKGYVLSVFLVFCTMISSSVLASGWFVGVDLGGGRSAGGETQDLLFNDVLLPNAINHYTADSLKDFSYYTGVGVGYNFELQSPISLDLGLHGGYLNFGKATGVVVPLQPGSDTLKYKYKASSFLLLAQARVIWKNDFNINPYFSAGVGSSWNKLFGYEETQPPGSTAAPMLNPYADSTKSSFAFSLGVGLEYDFENSMKVSLGYRYIDAGKAQLGASIDQTTNDRLQAGHVKAHLLALSFYFGE